MAWGAAPSRAYSWRKTEDAGNWWFDPVSAVLSLGPVQPRTGVVKAEATTYLALSTACPQGRFGPSCAQVCACGQGAACDPVLGTCICPPGKMGVHCERGECQLRAEHTQSSLVCHRAMEQAPEVNSSWEGVCPFPRDTFTLTATVNSLETSGLRGSPLPRGLPAPLANWPSHANAGPTHSGLLRVGSFSGLPVHVSVASMCPDVFLEGYFLVLFPRPRDPSRHKAGIVTTRGQWS